MSRLYSLPLQDGPQPVSPGLVRVFLSSTFRDMQAEREILVTRVFPALRQHCRRRGLSCAEIDLRWGITNEQAERGEILPVCLAEIERCNLFVGILGSVYGTRLQDLHTDPPPTILEQYPWVEALKDRSITELEIQHAVLQSNACCQHSLFYFRADSPGNLQHEHNANATALAELKQRIKDRKLAVRDGYRGVEQLAEWMSRDLVEAVNTMFPVTGESNAVRRRQSLQEYHARVVSRTFVGRRRMLDGLQAAVQRGSRPVLVTGPPGIGKTALVARWIAEHCRDSEVFPPLQKPGLRGLLLRHLFSFQKTSRKACPCLAHLAGVEEGTQRLTPLLRALSAELQALAGQSSPLPRNAVSLRQRFGALLKHAAAAGPLVVVLDGLDQFDPRDLEIGLAWLPDKLPQSLRLIATAGPGLIADQWRRRRWRVIELDELQAEDVDAHLSEYLGRLYGKQLEPATALSLRNAPALRQPLFARTVIEELRQLGDRSEVTRRAATLASQPSGKALINVLLDRWTNAFPGPVGSDELVRCVLMLLDTARSGLSEMDLRILCGSRRAPLPAAYLSPLLLALESWVINRGGVLSIAAHELREVIAQRWLATRALRYQCHQHLANHFSKESFSCRKADELPWHLAATSNWTALARLLADVQFLGDAWPTHGEALLTWWAKLEEHGHVSRLDVLQPLLDRPPEEFVLLQPLCLLVEWFAPPGQLLVLSERLLRAAEGVDFTATHDALLYRGAVLCGLSHLDEALQIYRRLEKSCRAAGDLERLSTALSHQGVVARRTGNLTLAAELHTQALGIAESADDVAAQSICLANLAVVWAEVGNFKGALMRLRQQEDLCRRAADLRGLLSCLGNRAALWEQRGRFRRALSDRATENSLARRLGDLQAVDHCLGSQARLLIQLEQYPEAIDRIYERVTWCDRFCLHVGRIESRRQLAGLYRELGQLARAIELEDEARRLAEVTC